MKDSSGAPYLIKLNFTTKFLKKNRRKRKSKTWRWPNIMLPTLFCFAYFCNLFVITTEYAYTMQVTAPGNVYSYGVILLEILTTRLPVDEAFGEGIDLVKWVHNAPARGETPEQILDSKLSTVSFTWRKEMLAALKVALICTDSTPAKRPKMKKVVEMLQEITQN